MTEKKSSKPELIEDSELDEASGGLLPAVKPTEFKFRSTDPTQVSASKIEIGALKAADGSV